MIDFLGEIEGTSGMELKPWVIISWSNSVELVAFPWKQYEGIFIAEDRKSLTKKFEGGHDEGTIFGSAQTKVEAWKMIDELKGRISKVDSQKCDSLDTDVTTMLNETDDQTVKQMDEKRDTGGLE